MIYILIFIGIYSQKATSLTAEFNDLPSCRAAAAEIQRQMGYKPDAVLCAQKGVQK